MIDLHCHSIFSDGTDAPEVLALKADEAGLTALALTDHDTIDGLPRFMAMQDKVKTRLIPGIEFSCRFLNMEIHVLGLFVDPKNQEFKEHIEELKTRREKRNLSMAERLRSLGIPITLAEVAAMAPSKVISRMHFAKVLVEKGVAGSRQDAFGRYIGAGQPGHVPFEDLLPDEASRWIKAAGGVPVIAHPGRSVNRSFRWDEAMADLKTLGIEGLEAYYGEYGSTEQQYYCDLADRLGMAKSGGSDYHGTYKPGLALGVGRGGLHVPDELLEELESRRNLAPDSSNIQA